MFLLRSTFKRMGALGEILAQPAQGNNMNPKDLLDIKIIEKIANKKIRLNNLFKSWNKSIRKDRKEREYKNRIPKKYKIYIKSKYWKLRRDKYFRELGRKCVVCGSSKYVNLHHLVYEDYGSEKNENLVVFCRFHHEEFHKEIGVKKNMVDETYQFIIDQRELLEFPKI